MKAKKRQAKQGSQLEILRKPLTKLDKRITIAIFVMALLLPMIGWAIGAYNNPNGWMSDSPVMAYIFAVFLLVYYWYISVPAVLLLLWAISSIKPNNSLASRLISYVVFVVSLVVSIFVMTLVEDANESEFTG